MEYLDDRVKTSEQVSALSGALTLGMIGQIEGPAANGKLVTVRNQQSPLAEAYRMLRVNLDFAAIDRPLRAIAVTSGGPEEGKSTTIANLAVAIAQTGKRVILVDSDLRRPTIHRIFQVANDRGVTTALLNPGDQGVVDHLISSGVGNLQLLPSGPIPPNPAELLGSQRMAELIEALKAQADLVLFDTPPLLVFADAALLARVCDGTLLVARARFTRIGALVRALEQIDQAGARLLGVVLNRVAAPRGDYQNYYYYYGSRADQQPKRRGLQWPFGRSSRRRKQAANAAELQRLRDGINAIKRTGSALDSVITRADVPAGGEYRASNANGHSPQDLGSSAKVPVAAGNSTSKGASGVLPTVSSSNVDPSASRNGHGIYPASK
jgi:non-specific protein-tyrosine kinase